MSSLSLLSFLLFFAFVVFFVVAVAVVVFFFFFFIRFGLDLGFFGLGLVFSFDFGLLLPCPAVEYEYAGDYLCEPLKLLTKDLIFLFGVTRFQMSFLPSHGGV